MFTRIWLSIFACALLVFSFARSAGEKQAPPAVSELAVRYRLNAIETSTLLENYQSLVKRELALQGSVRACTKSGDERLPQYVQALQEARADLVMTKQRLIALESEKAKLSASLSKNVTQANGEKLNEEQIGKAAGSKATTTPDGVVRLGWPRTDVAVTVDGMAFKPAAGLGSWAAFTPTKHGAMVMGDTVVFQDEVTPAMDAAFAGGLEMTGLHNHFFFDEPKVYFMHIGGQGEPEKLAAAVKSMWDAIKKVRAAEPKPATRFAGKIPQAGTISAAPLAKILGHKADTQGGVVKFTIARTGAMHGIKVGGSMGLTTWAAFTGTDDRAAVDGDFIMTAKEVQPVLRALRRANIHIVALHNHMIGEQPAYYFTHFWGKGPTEELARGIKTALDVQKEAGKAAKDH
jgi:hypothetical protein